MTFLEAAEALLKKSGEPLHYRMITERALAEGLIQSTGRTPDSTMGAQLYTAVTKAEVQGENGTFLRIGKGYFSLAKPVVRGTIQIEIADHHRRVSAELLKFLHEVHPRQLELIVGRLLGAIGFEDVRVTQYSNDGGIDVEAILTVGGFTRVRTAIQVKRYQERNNVRVNVVRELRGSLVTDQRGLIITTSGFARDAISEANADGKAPISLIDGKRLVELLMEQGIGAKKETIHLYNLQLDDLITDEPNILPNGKSNGSPNSESVYH